MNQQHILKYFISSLLIFFVHFINAQEAGMAQDSATYKQAYGLRLGFDISRPIIQTIQKQDIGVELTGDYRVADSWYVASEIGYESEPGTEDYLSFHTKGSYAKIGFNYNAYENWQGMSNEVYLGLRYGFGVFSQELNDLTIIDLDNYFGDYTAEPGTTFDGLTAHWFEIHFGLKVEVFHNLYLTTGIQFKKLLKDDKPDGFANLYIPGFQKVLLNNAGVGFNYTISYLIPFKKK
jgi:hypothetical protein